MTVCRFCGSSESCKCKVGLEKLEEFKPINFEVVEVPKKEMKDEKQKVLLEYKNH